MIFYTPLVLLACVAILLIVLYWHMKRHFSLFERMSIPGPKPSLLVGNLWEIMEKGQFQATVDWGRQYGRVFGYYEGYTPVLSVSDPTILREVLVKDAANFMSRKPFPLAPRKALGLFLENGKQWRRSRSLLTPAFSSGKLKRMMPIMQNSADILVDNLGRLSKKEKSVGVYSVFQSLTLDVIGRCAFGLQTQAQTDENDEFLTSIRSLFKTMSTTLILPLVMAVPFLAHFVFALKNVVFLFGMNPVVWLRLKLNEIIKIRKSMGPNSRVVDLVQLMLFPSKTRLNKHREHHDGSDGISEFNDTMAQMTEREIVAQSMTFLLAGYETTSAVLAFLAHALAQNPHVQERLQKEIDTRVGKEVNYDTVQNLPYFDMVFDEVCRLFPTASQIVTRQASESRVINGVQIPAGMNIHANIWALHHDADFWTEPEIFDPERFSAKGREEIKPFTFLPFGAGPRKCIGERFAILEAKMAIVKLMKQFSLSLDDEEQEPIKLIARGAIVPQNEVKVKVTRRVSRRQTNNRHG